MVWRLSKARSLWHFLRICGRRARSVDSWVGFRFATAEQANEVVGARRSHAASKLLGTFRVAPRPQSWEFSAKPSTTSSPPLSRGALVIAMEPPREARS